MIKYLGLDIGEVRIGVSISDEFGKFSLPLEVIDRTKVKAIFRIKDLVKEHNIGIIVVGVPKRANGNSEIQVEKIKLFTKKLSEKVKNINIVFEDERYTTKLAETYLKKTKKNNKEIRKVVDMMAANIILQNYLDKKNKMEEL